MTGQLPRPIQPPPAYVRAIIFVWVFVAASENLRAEYLPYVDWLLTVPALFCLLRYGRPRLSLPQGIFLVTVGIGGCVSFHFAHAAVWVGKLCAIFLCTSCLATAPGLPQVGFQALVAAMVCNLGMLVLGRLGMPGVSELMAARGRYGTLLNHPGALWHAGMAPLAFYSYLLLHHPKSLLLSLPATVACLAIVWCDGSRTAMVLIAGFGLILLVNALKQAPYLACGLVVLAMLAIPSLKWLEIADDNSLARILPVLESRRGWRETLEEWDPTRFEMIQHSCDLIADAPLLGNGFGASVVRVDVDIDSEGDMMVIHDGYLQVWGEFGLAGFLAYAALLWQWVPLACRAAPPLGVHGRAMRVNSLFLLTSFGLAQLFNPISVSWSDWMLFTIPFASLAQLSHSETPCGS